MLNNYVHSNLAPLQYSEGARPTSPHGLGSRPYVIFKYWETRSNALTPLNDDTNNSENFLHAAESFILQAWMALGDITN